MKNLTLLILVFITIACSTSSFAQNEVYQKGKKVEIKLNDGSEYIGRISTQTEDYLEIVNNFTNIQIKREDIKRIKVITYEGKHNYGKMHTRYFYSPSAIPLKKGEGYYQNLMLLVNGGNIGITDYFSIGGTFEFASLISGTPSFSITPKIGVQITDNIYVGAGLRVSKFFEIYSTSGYGVVTLGNEDSNLSLAGGFGISNSLLGFGPTVASATHRFSDRISIMSENWFWDIKTPIFNDITGLKVLHIGIHGVRLHSKRSTFDFGVMTTNLLQNMPLDFNGIIGIPFIGYTYGFSLPKRNKMK